MKKWIIFAALAALLLCGCGAQKQPETTPPETEPKNINVSVYQPADMVGRWVLTHTFSQGQEPVAAQAGRGTIQVTGEGVQTLQMSYTDAQYPEESFSEKALLSWHGQMYSGCGNDMWAADVDYISPEGTGFAVTLCDDGTLLLELQFRVGGSETFSYQRFARAEE